MFSAARVACLGLVVALSVPLTTASAAEVKARAEHVALFKNGYGVVRLRATLPKPDGGNEGLATLELPAATLGTFLLDWPAGVEVLSTRSLRVEDEAHAATSLAQLLQANVGQRVRVRIHGPVPAEPWRQVTIKAYPRAEVQPPTAGLRPLYAQPLSNPAPYGEIVLLEDEQGVSAVQIAQIAELQFLAGQKTTWTVNRPRDVLQVRYRLANDAQDPAVRLSYLAFGLAWSPSYVVDITDPAKARLTAKAVVLNDLMPLENVTVELVTGFPQLQFAHVPDAMSLRSLSDFLQALSASPTPGNRRNVMTQQMVINTYGGGDWNPVPPPAEGLPGDRTEDLAFYPLSAVTLDRSERAYFPLLSTALDYQHVYTLDIPDTIDEQPANRYGEQPSPESALVVWHAIKLTNATKLPWTTAPATTVAHGRLLGQDTLSYTPPGASSDLRITQALGLRPQYNELEVERQRNAANFFGSNYDLVTVRGEIALTNHMTKPVTLKITKLFSGELQNAEGKPTLTKLAKGLRQVNPRNQAVWQIDLPAAAEPVKLTYSYKIYVRN
jgi:hypothetical protein